jgi:hypothetical protein
VHRRPGHLFESGCTVLVANKDDGRFGPIDPPILVTDRIKQVLQDHGVTREMIEKRVAEHRPRGRHLSVDLNALTFRPGVVAAMLELVTEPLGERSW